MPQPSHAWVVGGARFTQPGDDEPESREELPDIGVDRHDPAFPYVVRALAHLKFGGFDVRDPVMLARAVEAGRERAAQAPPKVQAPPMPALPRYDPHTERRKPLPERERVYYVRIGDRCKIGYTASMWGRLVSLNPEELLAVEPGGRNLERERHVQFRKLRTHGEWFRLDQPLLDHVAELAAANRQEIEELARLRRPRRPARRLA